ncbi:hypothetical protein N7444_002799 [Penicillium canescens]|nr:hypothetical protein N7444_002799 [Penicillium canescens]
MDNPSKAPETTDTQGEVPLYTQPTSTGEPPLLGIATPLLDHAGQTDPNPRHREETLAVEPFRPMLEALKPIEEDNELVHDIISCFDCSVDALALKRFERVNFGVWIHREVRWRGRVTTISPLCRLICSGPSSTSRTMAIAGF